MRKFLDYDCAVTFDEAVALIAAVMMPFAAAMVLVRNGVECK